MQRLTPSQLSSVILPMAMGGGVALTIFGGWGSAAAAATLTAWQFDPAAQQLTLTLPTGVVPQYAPAQGGIVITLPNTQLGAVPTVARYGGPVQQIELFARDNAVDLVLTLAPGVALGEGTGQLVSLAGGEQTRWVFTPQVASSPIASGPSPGMIVELPPLPADPNLSWPYTGVGRLSISAANLMRPANLDTFNTLPETLAIDPFNLGLPTVTEQVSVPSLDELDAAVGVALPNPTMVVPSLATADTPTPTTRPTPATPNAGIIATPPPSGQPSLGNGLNAVAAIDAAIDQENGGQTIAVNPAPISATPPGNAIAQVSGPTASVQASAQTSALTPPFLTVPPPAQPAVDARNPAIIPSPGANSPLAVPTDPMVTTAADTASTVVIPPRVDPVMVAANPGAALSFGQPLPGSLARGPEPAWDDRHLAPDTLIAAGSILELRYTGSQSLTLDPSAAHREVLVLETEIRDPVTNGIVAPAGSQLIGQFQPSGDGHQWVSQMLIDPNGQRIPFASTSDQVYNSPRVDGSTVALGTGLGALALTLLTGFGGVGLLGGALIGATTAVGLSPQMLVIEPNQVIYAEVNQDIYRAMPIAAMPIDVQPWGSLPGTWQSPPP
ncbi:MAG: AMIN domain-containing protein [Leptolyngbya sp.]|nr:AMIN domain-containing protein [Leptolyngbya sp.]